MQTQNPAAVILSAFRPQYDFRHNCDRHAHLGQWLRERGFAIKSLVGRYKAEQEASWVAVLPAEYDAQQKALREIKRIAFVLCSQESVLFVDSHRDCELHYAFGEPESIGRLRPVAKTVADQHDGASYDPAQDQWYVCA